MSKICDILKIQNKCLCVKCNYKCDNYNKLRQKLINEKFLRYKEKGII